MSSEDIILLWRFPQPEAGHDMRTFNAHLELGPELEALHLYKFLTIPGVAESVTTFERWNISVRRWEIAGEIHWANNFSGQVQFGVHILRIQEIRRRKKQSSKSRRFMANDAEYKWKIRDDGGGLFCVDSRGRTVATWTQDSLELRVVPSAEEILDRLVVTCLVNLWFRAHGHW